MQIALGKNLSYHIYSLAEDAVTIEFGDHISDELFQKMSDLNRLINQKPFPGFKTTLQAYATLTVFFDPMTVCFSKELQGVHCFDKIRNYLANFKAGNTQTVEQITNKVIIPVYYNGPDLQLVAEHHHISTEQVIKLHSEAIYKVYMLGFVPGFAYLGGLPEQLTMPRKSAPRKAVPAGSVGIAGMQTAVYPMQTPGGWQIVGRTPVKMFDLNANDPGLLKPGDEVTFKPITEEEYNVMMEADHAN